MPLCLSAEAKARDRYTFPVASVLASAHNCLSNFLVELCFVTARVSETQSSRNSCSFIAIYHCLSLVSSISLQTITRNGKIFAVFFQ